MQLSFICTDKKKKTINPPIKNLRGEIWKDVKGYEGYYKVSNMGRVKSYPKEGRSKNNSQIRLIKASVNNNGYCTLKLCKFSHEHSMQVHTLVAEHFIERPRKFQSKRAVVNHEDGDRSNNKASNLKYTSYSENAKHGNQAILFINRALKLNRMVYLDNIFSEHLKRETKRAKKDN